tara:strand:+ start:1058 stop:1426 length:369 start_codon:yes stop_codon:yes gene_type:complete
MTTPKTITIDGTEYIRKEDAQSLPAVSEKFAVVRCRNAGVHAGEVAHFDESEVVLGNSRRLWQWGSKATLSELAMYGPDKDKTQKYACVLPTLRLTRSDVAEIIPCTKEAAQLIMEVEKWEN